MPAVISYPLSTDTVPPATDALLGCTATGAVRLYPPDFLRGLVARSTVAAVTDVLDVDLLHECRRYRITGASWAMGATPVAPDIRVQFDSGIDSFALLNVWEGEAHSAGSQVVFGGAVGTEVLLLPASITVRDTLAIAMTVEVGRRSGPNPFVRWEGQASWTVGTTHRHALFRGGSVYASASPVITMRVRHPTRVLASTALVEAFST